MIHDAAVLLASVNLSQLEFAAWFEVATLCLVRLFYLRRMRTQGARSMTVPLGARRDVLLCMLLLGAGGMIPNAVVILHGATGWGAGQVVWAALGKLLRCAAVYLYIRAMTYERDGNRLWLALLGGAVAFAILVKDR